MRLSTVVPAGLIAIMLLLSAVTAAAQDPGAPVCFTDPPGDTREPRLDLVEHCVTNTSGGLAVSVRMAAPSDPRSDPVWAGEGVLQWEFSGGGQAVVFEADQTTGQLTASTVSRFDRSVVCTRLTARHSGDLVMVPFVPHRCLEGTYEPDFSVSVIIGDDRAPDVGPGGEFTVDGPVPVQRFSVLRLEAADPVGAALTLSATTFPDGGASTAMIARNDTYADAGCRWGAGRALVPSAADRPGGGVSE